MSSAPRPAPARGLRGVRARPSALSPAAGRDGPGKGTRVRSPPGVLGDPSCVCSFIHSAPSPCIRCDLDSRLRAPPPRPRYQDLRASVPCRRVQGQTVSHSLRCPRPISATMPFTAVAPNWGLCVRRRPLGSGLSTAARGEITPPRPGSRARCAPVPREASLTCSPCSIQLHPAPSSLAGPLLLLPLLGVLFPDIHVLSPSRLLQKVPPQPSPRCPPHVELTPARPSPRRFGVPPEPRSRTYRKCPLFLSSVVLCPH